MGIALRLLGLAAMVVAGVGCVKYTPSDESFTCPTGLCPSGLTCNAVQRCVEHDYGPFSLQVYLTGGPTPQAAPMVAMGTLDVNCGGEGPPNVWAFVVVSGLQPADLQVVFQVTDQAGGDLGGGRGKFDHGGHAGTSFVVYVGELINGTFPLPKGVLTLTTTVTDTLGDVLTDTQQFTVDQKCVFGGD